MPPVRTPLLLVIAAALAVPVAEAVPLPGSASRVESAPTLPETKVQTGSTMAEHDPSRYPPLLGAGAQPISGKIPYVFYNTAHYSNSTGARVHLTVPDGLVYITDVQPTHYQYVVVLAGETVNLAPGESADLEFYTMCIDRPGAVPPNGVRMSAVGLLPNAVIDTMLRYRDLPANDPQLGHARDATIDAINTSVTAFLECAAATHRTGVVDMDDLPQCRS